MKFLRNLIMKRRRRCSSDTKKMGHQETGSLDETNSSTSAPELAPWRVENILLTGAPRDSDWWEQERDKNNSNDGEGAPAFRNRGKETWLLTRQAWTQRDRVPTDGRHQQRQRRLAKQPSANLKRDLIKNLGDKSRQCDLPRRIPLSAMIDVYTDIWNGNDGSD